MHYCALSSKPQAALDLHMFIILSKSLNTLRSFSWQVLNSSQQERCHGSSEEAEEQREAVQNRGLSAQQCSGLSSAPSS